MSALWLVAIPSGVWATRTLGNTINQSLFRQNKPEPPNPHLDHAGALVSAEAALAFINPISPTVSHLRQLVHQSAKRLRLMVNETEERVHRQSWSRYLRDPDFSKENRDTEAEINTLKSRVSLLLSVVQLFPETNERVFSKILEREDFHASSEEEEEEEEDDSAPPETTFWQQLMQNAKL